MRCQTRRESSRKAGQNPEKARETGPEEKMLAEAATTGEKTIQTVARLSSLCKNAIELVTKCQRTEEEMEALLETLQSFKGRHNSLLQMISEWLKENRYPTFDDIPGRPSPKPNQIIYLSQITPGMRVRLRCTKPYSPLKEFKIVSAPYKQNGTWIMKVTTADSDPGNFYLEHARIVPRPTGIWEQTKWLEPLPEKKTVASNNGHK